MARRPPIRHFFLYYFQRFQMYFLRWDLAQLPAIVLYVIHPFGISVMFFLFSYFTQKLFCFLYIQLLVFTRSFSTDLLVEFSFVISECPILLVLHDNVEISFESPFFCLYLYIYLFMLHCQILLLFCSGFLIPSDLRVFLRQQAKVIRKVLITFACCLNFLPVLSVKFPIQVLYFS